MSTPLCVAAVLLVWSLYGILWSMFSDHEWTEPRDTILAGPLYWGLNLAHHWGLISFSPDYDDDELHGGDMPHGS